MGDFDRLKLKAELERDEGRRSRAYQDSVGVWTVGVGFNLEANLIPDDVIDRLFAISVGHAEMALDLIEPRWRELDDDRQRVLVNMAFNLGPIRFSMFKAMWSALREHLVTGSHEALDRAAAEMEDSTWFKQVGARGVRLRDRMRATVRV